MIELLLFVFDRIHLFFLVPNLLFYRVVIFVLELVLFDFLEAVLELAFLLVELEDLTLLVLVFGVVQDPLFSGQLFLELVDGHLVGLV